MTPRATLAGHWRCGNCGRAHPEQRWADECCGLVKAIAASDVAQDFDETDRREAVMETEIEKLKRERDEARARATRDNDSMASDRIAAALLIQGERARAEKAEARVAELEAQVAEHAFIEKTRAELAKNPIRFKCEHGDRAFDCLPCEVRVRVGEIRGLTAQLGRSEAALRKCVVAMDRIARLLEQHWANGMGRPPGNRPEWFDEALAAAREVLGG